jgi:hypothetical protein
MLVPTLAYAGLTATAAGAALFAGGRLDGLAIASGTTAKGTAFVFAYTVLAGPRVLAPRRQLVRLLSGVARSRRATALAGLAIAGITAGAAIAGWYAPPYFWPFPSPYGVVGRLADLARDLY